MEHIEAYFPELRPILEAMESRGLRAVRTRVAWVGRELLARDRMALHQQRRFVRICAGAMVASQDFLPGAATSLSAAEKVFLWAVRGALEARRTLPCLRHLLRVRQEARALLAAERLAERGPWAALAS